MLRKFKEFNEEVEKYLIYKGASLSIEKPFRFKEFIFKNVVYTLPYIQKYTYSVHVKVNHCKDYNFHNTIMNYNIAINKFKKHAEILWV
jgi:hypothetical protein